MKIILKKISSLLLLIFSFAGLIACDSNNNNIDIPKLTLSDIDNVEEGMFDISSLLPNDLSPEIIIVYSAVLLPSNFEISVINGVFYVVKGNQYLVSISLTYKDKHEDVTFKVIAKTNQIPSFTINDIVNAPEGNFNIAGLLPSNLDKNTNISYSVKQTPEDVSVEVVNGVFYVEKDYVYQVIISLSLEESQKIVTFTVTAVQNQISSFTVENYTGVLPGWFNIKDCLPSNLDSKIVYTYQVLTIPDQEEIPVVNSLFEVVLDKSYLVTVTLTIGKTIKVVTFTVTSENSTNPIPDFTINNYVDVNEGWFNILEKLPNDLPLSIIVSYNVKEIPNQDNISVINGLFTVEKDKTYLVTVNLKQDEYEKNVTFTVTAIITPPPIPEPNNVALVTIPFASNVAGIDYRFGLYKILGLTGTYHPLIELDHFTLNFVITEVEGETPFNSDYVITFNNFIAGTAEANAIATIDENNVITFYQPIKVDIRVTSVWDKDASQVLTIFVNGGFNIYESRDLRNAFALEVSSSKPINMQTSIVFDSTADPFKDMFISTKGETIYGNKHTIDATSVTKPVYIKRTNDADRTLGVLNFVTQNGGSIYIDNLIVKGNGENNVVHSENPKNSLNGITIVPISNGLSFPNDPLLNQYDYSTRSEDNIKVQLSSKHSAYRHHIQDVTVINVTVLNTLVGFRLQNIENLYFKNVVSQNSFLHNIEVHQVSKSIFEDLKLGYNGGASIEFKEDYSKIYKFDAVIVNNEYDFTNVATTSLNQKLLVPADAYDSNTIINSEGLITAGNVYLTDGTIKELNALTPDDKPFYVLKRANEDYVESQSAIFRGTFECENNTVGDEAYYMTPGGSPDSSNKIIMAIKITNPDSVHHENGRDYVNYAIGLINWVVKNNTVITFEDPNNFGFMSVNADLVVILDAASWAYPENSVLWVYKNN